MKKDLPQYRIKYVECKEKGHSGQINNWVCLNKNCIQASLICTFCRQQKHKGHLVQPLKHYLSNLYKLYKGGKSKSNEEIQYLQTQKNSLLLKLKESVETIALKFMDLQQQIINKYQSIKTQLLQKQFRRNNFQVFYNSMTNQTQGDPIFQIQNYLKVQVVQSFKHNNNIQNFTNIAIQQIKQISQNLTQKLKVQHGNDQVLPQKNSFQNSNILNLNQTIMRPPNIIQQGNILTQTLFGVGKGLGCLNLKFNEFTGKIKVKVISLKPNAKLTFGVVDFTTFSSAYNTFDQNNNNYQWFDSQGKSKNVNYNYINNLVEGQVFDVLIKKNHCKITSKGNMCDIQLHKKNQSVFFYNLDGNCKIELTYTNFKD